MDQLKQWVADASVRPEVRAELRRLYADVQIQIDQRRPVCVMSGRCCRFEEYGHRLFVTTIELAAFVRELAELPQTSSGCGPAGGCPFQSGKICRVHSIRPFGCRIFFCDPSSTQWQQEVYEQFHARLKKIHLDLSIPYAYVEWRFACQRLGLGSQTSNHFDIYAATPVD